MTVIRVMMRDGNFFYVVYLCLPVSLSVSLSVCLSVYPSCLPVLLSLIGCYLWLKISNLLID